MKNKTTLRSCFSIRKIALLVGILGLLSHATSAGETRPSGMSFQMFYDELQPYGDWISDPVHGYVWVPYADAGFQPYATNGYWVMSTYGNTWVSNYDWGWAPFHYGRWYFDDYLGWAWVPGYEWGPAWVNWRTGGEYYGWAPLMPGLNVQVSMNIPTSYWVFVPKRRFISRNVYNYYVSERNVYHVYNQTTVINNTYIYNNKTYASGPARREVERATRRSVPVYQIDNSNKPGRTSVSRTALQVYQPSVRQAATSGRASQPRPTRVVSASEHKTNLENRSSARSRSVNDRTVPNNSRVTNTRSNDATRAGAGIVNRVESETRRPASPTQNATRVLSPSRAETPVSPQRKLESQSPVRQQPKMTNPGSTRQPQSTAASRSQVTRQRSESDVPSRRQNVQPSQGNSSGNQEVRRSPSTPRVVSPASGRERNSGSTGGTTTRSRSSTSSRGNN